jgi:hypothetical protein
MCVSIASVRNTTSVTAAVSGGDMTLWNAWIWKTAARSASIAQKTRRTDMAHFETVLDIGQKFWTIRAVALYRSGKRTTVGTVDEHSVDEIRIFGNEENDIVYCDEYYTRFAKSDIGTNVFLSESDAKLALGLIEAAEE